MENANEQERMTQQPTGCSAIVQLNLVRGQKFCGKCRQFRPIGSFSLRTDRKSPRRASECVTCSSSRSNRWYFANTQRALSRHRIKLLRDQVVTKLGARCSNPNCLVPGGCVDARALQIDHVNDDGAEERKKYGAEIGPRGGQRQLPRSRMAAIYQLALEDTEGRYQLLCANCNVIKEHERRQEKYRQRQEAHRAA